MKPLSEQELREKILDWYKNLGIKPGQKDKLLTVSVTELTRFIAQDRKAHEESIKNIIKMSDKYTFADGTVFVRQRNQGEEQN